MSARLPPIAVAGAVMLWLLSPLAGAQDTAAGPAFLWKCWLLVDDAGDANLSFGFSPDRKLVAVTDGQGRVKTWRIADGAEAGSYSGKAVGTPLALAFAADGKRLLLAGQEGVTVWDATDASMLTHFRWPEAGAETVAFSPDGGRVAVGGSDGTLMVCGLDGKPLLQCGALLPTVLAVCFSSDGKLLASGSIDGTIRLWDIATGNQRTHLFAADRAIVRGLAFSPDGALLASVGGRDGVTLWDLAAETVRARWGARPQPYRSIAFAPDGRTIACGSAHGAVDVWDVADPRRHALVRSHIGLARELKFVDAVTLGSAGSDGVVRLWEGGRRVERGEALGEAQVASVAQTLFYAPEGPALRAVLRLAAVPDDAIPQLRAALRPGRPPAGEVVARYLVALDSDRFVTRAAAARALEDLGPLALPALNKALDVPMTLETRRRLQQIIGRLEERVRAESSRLFGLRSVLVLERIGSAAALGLLKEMSTGVPDEAVQREAQQALARLR